MSRPPEQELDGGSGAAQREAGSAVDVFWAFLALGLTSFGGPVAHLGYFRNAFVVRRRWLSEAAYADLVALCQFLPGPASSQVGMAIGLRRAGFLGLLAAWTAFTLPSAALLVAFAYGAQAYGDALGAGWLQGLKAAAAAVVAHAVLGMARTLTPDAPRLAIAAVAATMALSWPSAVGQIAAIALGGAAGVLLPGAPPVATERAEVALPVGRKTALAALALFFALLVLLPLLAAFTPGGAIAMADAFYRAGSLVFGGGHVVLPLLQAEVVETGIVTRADFLAGYGAAQAVPGPLFSIAAYLGAAASAQPNGIVGATLALVAIFLPSALLVVGALPFWERLRGQPAARRALAGVNASVVGLLAAAFYDPALREGVVSAGSLAIAVAAFAALVFRVPAWAVVVAAALAGALLL